SGGNCARCAPPCPRFPPRLLLLFDFFLALRLSRSLGESLDGGRCELLEFRPSFSASSASCFASAATRPSSSEIRASLATRSASFPARSRSSSAIRSSRLSLVTPYEIHEKISMERTMLGIEQFRSLTRSLGHPLNGYVPFALSTTPQWRFAGDLATHSPCSTAN